MVNQIVPMTMFSMKSRKVFFKKIRTPLEKNARFLFPPNPLREGWGYIYLLELDGEHLDKMAEIKHNRLLTEYFLMILFLKLF